MTAEQIIADVSHRMQVGQTRVIIKVIEDQAKRYAMGELPRVSPQMALQALATALKQAVDGMETQYGRVPV